MSSLRTDGAQLTMGLAGGDGKRDDFNGSCGGKCSLWEFR